MFVNVYGNIVMSKINLVDGFYSHRTDSETFVFNPDKTIREIITYNDRKVISVSRYTYILGQTIKVTETYQEDSKAMRYITNKRTDGARTTIVNKRDPQVNDELEEGFWKLEEVIFTPSPSPFTKTRPETLELNVFC
jgi:hypothetical protein